MLSIVSEHLDFNNLPATAAEDHYQDDKDGDDTGSHTNYDGHVLGADGVRPWVSEGQGHIALGHAAGVESHAGVLTKVTGGHGGHCQAEVSLNTTFKIAC